MISLTPVWLNPLKPWFRSRFSRCEPIAPSAEFVGLGGGDQTGLKQAIDPGRLDRPTLAFGEGLVQVSEIGERLHHPHPAALELIAQPFEIELAFQVVHSRLEQRFAVQCAPQPDRPQVVATCQRLMGEVDHQLVR